ncbi:bifunctional 2',3'-cyclic-nucleotide 2'-phosphodiesterase/3'-nucleotidase [Sedimentitalea todarodis]|uniref:Bifunctional 2',3'-cyclic-nucleotide 2'-phosphodiesterase/3'-nucleotidase n=1 Tax=Sedimentitalea todarodis TaxID=1631240 RepID=A0ABU3V9M5_9RHOB|nr:bifunctional 2',3'-cyclic-nucleotide 2'-phosphodiesterase/3'-nucleotidase [Sedimentitalea todarodis]MDU9002865.1 bifunctional 2',3'-cyclic-nucleotide 2'-phosphodiesterase/3'-nucleotidase [Sedimentitalea todarodis]
MTDRRRVLTGTKARLRLLATTDLHMNLMSHDYYADLPDPFVGLTRTASLIHAARAEAEADDRLVLLFDNGDAFQGAPMSDVSANDPDQSHPLMRAFAYLRYDAIGLGNHDFNFGLKPLNLALQQSPCPVLCSNMQRIRRTKSTGFEPFAILDRLLRCGEDEWPIRIGVLSFLPPQTIQWDAHHLRGQMQTSGIVETARRWLPDLKAAGCDLVVALAHTGLSNTPDHTELENAARPLAELDGIDAVISGHTHLRLPGPDHCGINNVDTRTGSVHGTPVVMAGTSGSHLGVIDLDLVADAQHKWKRAGFQCSLRPIALRTDTGKPASVVPEDPALVALLSEDHAQTRELMRQPVGSSAVSLHSYFSFFAPDRALALVAAAQAAAVRPHLAGTEAEGLPLISATAPGKFGGRAGPNYYTDIPAGPLSYRHIADLHVFPNELRAAIVSGAQLLEWLEVSARLFNHIEPGGTGQMLVDDSVPGHDFDVLHGLTYEIDLSAPSSALANGKLHGRNCRRIVGVRYAGRPVEPDARFVVVMNSYRASGSGPFALLSDVPMIKVPAVMLREVIGSYLSGQLSVDPLQDAPAPWRFAPMPDTRVTALTGPGARRHMAELDDRDVDIRRITPEGFLQLDIAV